MIVYDIEIKKAIVKKGEQKLAGIEYCAGFNDHANMGISCICAYDYEADRYRVFMDDNLDAFRALLATGPLVVGFNSLSFDNRVCAVNGIEVGAKNYDVLVELWKGAGLGPSFAYPSHMGFGLDACGQANFGQSKTGNGALAPVDYQQKRYGSLIDYCLNDVALTKKLLDRIIETGALKDPRDASKTINVRKPADPQ